MPKCRAATTGGISVVSGQPASDTTHWACPIEVVALVRCLKEAKLSSQCDIDVDCNCSVRPLPVMSLGSYHTETGG